MNRRITNIINWILDNLLPPIIRDSKIFYFLFYYPVFGSKTKKFAAFKNKGFFLNHKDFINYYNDLEDKHIKRQTDLSGKSIEYILKEIKGDIILDIACGRGYLTQLIGDKNPNSKVIGIDMIIPENISSKNNVTFMQGNVEHISLKDKTIDTIICAHTLEHVQNIEQAINELRRVAKKKLIIIVPCQREYLYTFDLHLHFFPYKSSFYRIFKNQSAIIKKTKNDYIYIEEY